MRTFSFSLNTDVKFGVGEAKRLPEYLAKLNFQKIGLLVDLGVSKSQYWKEIEAQLFEQCDIVHRAIGPTEEPSYTFLDQARSGFMNKTFECIIGVGGGSTLDCAKAISVLITNPKPAIEYRGFDLTENPGPPVIAIPTTSGTGSEVSPNAVFVDKKEKRKLGINTNMYVPKLAILDPKLTVSCPKSVTISSGIDALVHAIEGFATCNATSISRMFSTNAFELIYNALPYVVEEPNDLELRSQMQLGAYYAIIGLFNAGGGPTGALSYPLGVHFEVPHGMAGAVFLPRVIQHNVEHGYTGYTDLCQHIKNIVPPQDPIQASYFFSEKIWELCDQLEIPRTLQPFGIDPENVPILKEQVPFLEGAFEMNPVPFTVNDAYDLIESMVIE